VSSMAPNTNIPSAILSIIPVLDFIAAPLQG
jgi:hypothetical protein